MKPSFWSRFKTPALLSWWDFLWILLPGLIWYWFVRIQARTISIHCKMDPQTCLDSSIPWLDRISVHLENPMANRLSFVTQNIAALIAALVPLGLGLLGKPRVAWRKAFLGIAVDWVLLIEIALWNGVFCEAARLIVQRPRPFVYKDPAGLGMNPAHYTSFYSGHTSFTSAILLGTLLVLISTKLKNPTGIAFGVTVWALLTFLTGLFRVLSGRHFISDVMAGAVAGALVAIMVLAMHRRGGRSALTKL